MSVGFLRLVSSQVIISSLARFFFSFSFSSSTPYHMCNTYACLFWLVEQSEKTQRNPRIANHAHLNGPDPLTS